MYHIYTSYTPSTAYLSIGLLIGVIVSETYIGSLCVERLHNPLHNDSTSIMNCFCIKGCLKGAQVPISLEVEEHAG